MGVGCYFVSKSDRLAMPLQYESSLGIDLIAEYEWTCSLNLLIGSPTNWVTFNQSPSFFSQYVFSRLEQVLQIISKWRAVPFLILPLPSYAEKINVPAALPKLPSMTGVLDLNFSLLPHEVHPFSGGSIHGVWILWWSSISKRFCSVASSILWSLRR